MNDNSFSMGRAFAFNGMTGGMAKVSLMSKWGVDALLMENFANAYYHEIKDSCQTLPVVDLKFREGGQGILQVK